MVWPAPGCVKRGTLTTGADSARALNTASKPASRQKTGRIFRVMRCVENAAPVARVKRRTGEKTCMAAKKPRFGGGKGPLEPPGSNDGPAGRNLRVVRAIAVF